MTEFNSYLEEISNSAKPLVSSGLLSLSDMTQEERVAFRETWPAMSAERRRDLISRLVMLAEDNVELNFDYIFQMGLDDEDPLTRAQSIEGLLEYERRDLIAPLIRLLRGDPDVAVRGAAATALGRFALLAELQKLRPEDARQVEEALLSAIDDDEEALEVRRRCVEAIASMRLPRVNQVIQEAYRSPDLTMKASAIFAMGRNCQPRWLPTLLKELENAEPMLRYEAAAACGELATEAEAAVPQLMALVHDRDVEVRMAALMALGKIGGDRAKQALRNYLQDSDERVRELAALALEELASEESPLNFDLLTQ